MFCPAGPVPVTWPNSCFPFNLISLVNELAFSECLLSVPAPQTTSHHLPRSLTSYMQRVGKKVTIQGVTRSSGVVIITHSLTNCTSVLWHFHLQRLVNCQCSWFLNKSMKSFNCLPLKCYLLPCTTSLTVMYWQKLILGGVCFTSVTLPHVFDFSAGIKMISGLDW